MTQKRTKRTYILGIAVAFLLPLSFFVIAKVLKKDRVQLPGYFMPTGVDSQLVDGKMVYDTLYHRVGDLQGTNQLGRQVSLNEDLKDRVLLVNLFFTSCPSICPRLSNNIGMLQRAFRGTARHKNDSMVHFVSLSVDPARDSVPALRAYAGLHHANHDRWWFLTGSKQDFYNYARHELGLLASPETSGADELLHSETLVLIDKDRYIRGYYNGLDSIDLKRCADDIGWLSLEKKRKVRR